MYFSITYLKHLKDIFINIFIVINIIIGQFSNLYGTVLIKEIVDFQKCNSLKSEFHVCLRLLETR